jgi:Ca2+-binding RTX toxin-like protein
MGWQDQIGHITYPGGRGVGALIGTNDLLTSASVALDENGRLREGFTVEFADGSRASGISVESYLNPDLYDGGGIALENQKLNIAVVELGSAVGDQNGWFGVIEGSPFRPTTLSIGEYEGSSGSDNTAQRETVSANYDTSNSVIDYSIVPDQVTQGNPLFQRFEREKLLEEGLDLKAGWYIVGVQSVPIEGRAIASLMFEEGVDNIKGSKQDNGNSPFLVAANLSISDLNWSIGDAIEFTWQIRNVGDAGASSSYSGVYLSRTPDPSIDDLDEMLLIRGDDSGTLLTQEGRSFSATVEIDAELLGLTTGTYYAFAMPDVDNDILEMIPAAIDPDEDRPSNVIAVTFSPWADAPDLLTGTDGPDRILGLAGDNTISGLGGNDTLRGDAGDDVVSGGAGNDQIFAGPDDTGVDTLDGGPGDDVLGGGAGNDTILLTGGSDTVYGGSGGDAVSVAGSATVGNTVVWAGGGDDTVATGGGDDIFGGGDGSDELDGGGGSDTVYGGGDAGADTIFGGSGDDLIFAGAGDDVIFGGDGDDEIYNGAGNDVVDAGGGADEIFGGPGNDTLTGGVGADTFLFFSGNGDDVVTDFAVAADLIFVEGGRAAVTIGENADGHAVMSFADVTVTFLGVSGAELDDASLFV